MSHTITDQDRRAAEELRALFADASGLWIKPGDDSALSDFIVRHRLECERQMIESMYPVAAKLPSCPRLPNPQIRSVKRRTAA